MVYDAINRRRKRSPDGSEKPLKQKGIFYPSAKATKGSSLRLVEKSIFEKSLQRTAGTAAQKSSILDFELYLLPFFEQLVELGFFLVVGDEEVRVLDVLVVIGCQRLVIVLDVGFELFDLALDFA